MFLFNVLCGPPAMLEGPLSYKVGIASVRFLTQLQSATVYCICTILSSSLSTFHWLISPAWLNRFWPDLATSTRWPSHLCHMTRLGGKGHIGVTGVKKVIFTKYATPPTDYRVWSCDSCICISLTPSTKLISLKNHPGSFGVTGVKRSFSLKMR